MSGGITITPPGTGMIPAATPFVAPDFTPTPLSFRFLFELFKNSGSYAQRLAALEAKMGVTDGSNAAPGQIGEFMQAGTPTAVTLVNGSIVNLVSLNLTAGDWDVFGNAYILLPSGGTASLFGVGVGTALDTVITATFQAGPIAEQLNTALQRYNVTATTTVWMVGQCDFTGTAPTVSGSIRARRIR